MCKNRGLTAPIAPWTASLNPPAFPDHYRLSASTKGGMPTSPSEPCWRSRCHSWPTVRWRILAVVVVLGGVGSVVQPIVAQAQGARRYRRASQAVWTALWATLCTVPLYIASGAAGHLILRPFGFADPIRNLAVAFWMPR